MKKLFVADYTLCAVSGGRGTQLLFREKVALAEGIKAFGIDAVELPAVKNPKEDRIVCRTISSLLNGCRVVIPCAKEEDLSVSFECIKEAENPCIKVELPASDVQMEYSFGMKKPAMLARAAELVSRAKAICPVIEFSALDATRANPEFLTELVDAAVNAGADIITLCDDEGVSLPGDIAAFVAELRPHVPGQLYIKTGDTIGLACANALSAIKAGADGVKCALDGSGVLKTDLFAAAVAAKSGQLGVKSDLALTEIHSGVESLMARISHRDYLGANTQSSETDEIFLDSLSDFAGVKAATMKLGYDLSDKDNGRVYDAMKRICEKKSSIGSKELEAIIASSAMQVPSTYHLKIFNISTSNVNTAMAYISLVRDSGDEFSGMATGDGPIDAAFRAIENCVGFHYELDDFQIQAVTEGKESLGSSLVRLRSNGKLYSGNGLSTDIVGASIRAYVNALNKIVYEENSK